VNTEAVVGANEVTTVGLVVTVGVPEVLWTTGTVATLDVAITGTVATLDVAITGTAAVVDGPAGVVRAVTGTERGLGRGLGGEMPVPVSVIAQREPQSLGSATFTHCMLG
jgi:hypothetical protein